VPRGLPVGIEGAPDTLPATGAMAGAGWSVCALWGQDGTGRARGGVLVALHRDDATGPLPASAGFTVAGPDRLVYLIWNGRRFALTAEWMPRVLGYESAQPATAGWLNQLPAGPDIVPVVIPGRGEVGPAIGDGPARVGQVFAVRVPGTPERYFVLLRDGLRELSPTAFALVMGDPATASAYPGQAVRALEISPYELSRLPASQQALLSEAVPAVPPGQTALRPGQTWCVESTAAGTTVAVRAVPAVAGTLADARLTRTEQTADAVTVGAGLGGLVREARPGQAPGNSYFLVTDTGAKYPLTPAVADMLGYPPAGATPTPAGVLALLPTGPVLDPVAART
jgi:type VII secretion protein EccB